MCGGPLTGRVRALLVVEQGVCSLFPFGGRDGEGERTKWYLPFGEPPGPPRGTVEDRCRGDRHKPVSVPQLRGPRSRGRKSRGEARDFVHVLAIRAGGHPY